MNLYDTERQRLRRIRQIAQARGIIQRRRNNEAKNALRFTEPQVFLLMAVPFRIQGQPRSNLHWESFTATSFAAARKHAARCQQGFEYVALLWTNEADAIAAMSGGPLVGVELYLKPRRI